MKRTGRFTNEIVRGISFLLFALLLAVQPVLADPLVIKSSGSAAETKEEGAQNAGQQAASGNTGQQAASVSAGQQEVSGEGGQQDAASSLAMRLQQAKKDIQRRQVGRYGMVPVYARDIEEGTYPVRVESTSAFFKIPEAYLTVADGEMTARITIRSMSYQYVFPGSAEEAGRTAEADLIGYEEVDGCTVFTIPVEALDAEIPCAAYSRKRRQWYDRMLVFDAASLPQEALRIELPDYELIQKALEAFEPEGVEWTDTEMPAAETSPHLPPEAVKMSRSDGEYAIDVNMTGGSGRASISSPTLLIVRDGQAYARLIWSSTYYDYMIVDGETYHNLTTDGGNSVFEIPITVMDQAMPVIADTTAMGDPLEIEYTLTFYSDSVGDKGRIPQEAAKKVLLIALVILVAGGILNHMLKRKRS